MKILKEKYLELMQEKLNAMNEMLATTESQIFTGTESLVEAEAKAFADYYKLRVGYFAQIKKIEEAMESLDPLDEKDIADAAFTAKVVGFREKMISVAREMALLDEANVAAYNKISAHLRKDENNA